MKGGTGGGEIVQVQGGHILRGTGRKDRHSKVYTAKGPRDRRVRLSAHTAIQFYDVQDRLGYDRPSKAVDWLIKKAQNAIDKLAELPPWNPSDTTTTVAPNTETDLGSSSMVIEHQQDSSSGYAYQLQKQLEDNPDGNSSYIPQRNETQCIADSMRSFFPTSSGTSLMNFQNYPHDVMSRGSIQTEDLGLSLHTLQDSNSNHRPSSTDHHQVHFSGSNTQPFDANYAKSASWGGVDNGENRMGFIFSSQSISPYPLFNQSSAIEQRESLQSNYSQLIQAWNNRSLPTEDHQSAQATNQSSISSSHFNSEFQVPARFQGEEEEPGELPQRGSMSSSISRY